MKEKDHSNRGPKRKGDAVNAEAKAPRLDDPGEFPPIVGDEVPPGESERELREQIEDLSKDLESSRQRASAVQQENQGLRDLLEQNELKLAEETRKADSKEQTIQSLFREIAELKVQFGMPAPTPPTVIAEQESQQPEWTASDSGEDDQLPSLATDF